MNREKFEKLVERAVESLPDEFLTRLQNVYIVVEDYASPAQNRRLSPRRNQTLLGLYEGVPLTKRGVHYGLVPPDKITLFQKPIESRCRNDDEVIAEIERVVKHEIAHHFGISDERLRQIERGKH